ncbi:OstA family protein [[Leptolyngbya] sp. PCC 7376]|nr:OstA family protein [[Leptolyngbya] sp. PCC 7376]
MSAIAAFCALNCAVASIPADVTAQSPQPIAQIPADVEPQEFPAEEPIFNGVQIEDRTNESQQQFSLEDPPITPTTEDGTETEASVEVAEEELRVLEVIGDRQEYDELTNIVTAVGDVVVRFNESVLTADRLQINLNTKLAIAEGNVALQRGQQLLRGDRFDYFFVQNRGYIRQAQGEVSQQDLSQDLSAQPTPSISNISDPAILLNERLLLDQPISNVNQTNDGFNIVVGSSRGIENRPPLENNIGTVNRIRYYAEEVEFFEDRWEAKNIRLTNDPFNPPELQVIADTATYRDIDEFTSELVTTDTRLVIDDNVSLPIYPRTYRFDSSDDEGIFSLVSIGFDDEDRGGFFIQRRFTLFKNQQGKWTVTPQYLVQKVLFPDNEFGGTEGDDSAIISPDVFGLTTDFNYNFNPRVFVIAKGSIPNLSFENLEDDLKVNFRFEQLLGNLANPFRLSQEFNYRDRLFNGSLGFQRVQRSLGIVLRSPRYVLGRSGFVLDYQASIQNIVANTDRRELLGIDNPLSQDEVNLTRYQATASLNHSLPLWSGQALPSTPDEGLRFSARPVVPYLSLQTGVRGVSSLYSNGDQQITGTARIGLQGQIGHFSHNFFDYTGFNVAYSFGSRGESPFLFDRLADSKTLSFGLTQQIYGPIRAGFQTAINLDNNDAISTDYFLEYSRRTHSILIRYNPVLEIGSFNFRINDFDWSGSTDPFVNQDVRPVIDGVIP